MPTIKIPTNQTNLKQTNKQTSETLRKNRTNILGKHIRDMFLSSASSSLSIIISWSENREDLGNRRIQWGKCKASQNSSYVTQARVTNHKERFWFPTDWSI